MPAPDLRAALEGLLARYVRMVDSCDCVFWDPETVPVMVAARAALAQAQAAEAESDRPAEVCRWCRVIAPELACENEAAARGCMFNAPTATIRPAFDPERVAERIVDTMRTLPLGSSWKDFYLEILRILREPAPHLEAPRDG